MFSQTGAISVGSLQELVEFTRIFSTQPLPRGNRLGILTTSGSLGAVATDEAIISGLELPRLYAATTNKLRVAAPEWMNVNNPLDVGPSGLYVKALSMLMEDPHIDMVLAITLMPYAVFSQLKSDQQFWDIAAIAKRAPHKPLLVCALGKNDFLDHVKQLSGPEIPVLTSPEMAVRALAALWRYRKWREHT
jgi:acetyltransferase